MLKYIVIIAMVVDHVAWKFVDGTHPIIGGIMHVFGRFTGPTMAYFLGEGYSYSHDVKKYQQRLGIFAVISWIPFCFMENGTLPIEISSGGIAFHPEQSVIYTLFLGITAIRVWDSEKFERPVKITIVTALCMISCIGDWAVMDVLAPLFVHIYRNDPKAKWTAFTLTFAVLNVPIAVLFFKNNWFQLGVLLVPVILMNFYNGKGGSKKPFHKWFFYIFYPAHMLVIGIIRYFVLA